MWSFSFVFLCPGLKIDAGFASRYLSVRNISYRKKFCAIILALFESWQKVRSVMTLKWCSRSQAIIHAVSLKKIYVVLKTLTLTVTCIKSACSHGKILGSKLFYLHLFSERLDKSCTRSKYTPKLYGLKTQDIFTNLNIVSMKAHWWDRNKNWVLVLTVLCRVHSYVLGHGGEKI